MAENYPGEEVSEQLDSSIESSSSSDSSRASSPDGDAMLRSTLQEHLDSSKPIKSDKITKPIKSDKITKPIKSDKITKTAKITESPPTKTAETLATKTDKTSKTRVQDLKLKAKMLGIKGYSKLNKKQLKVVLSIHPEPHEPLVQSPAEPPAQPPATQQVEPKTIDPKGHQAHEKLSKMNLTELKALSKEAGIKLSYYSKEKAKSIAKTRKMLISDLATYRDKL